MKPRDTGRTLTPTTPSVGRRNARLTHSKVATALNLFVMPLSPGERLGPYEILALIGKGGMGEVYRARDPRLHRDVAVKVLPQAFATEAARERFQREARAASALNHPNICAVYDVGEAAGHPFLVMELLDGKTLREYIGGEAARCLDGAGAGHSGGRRTGRSPCQRDHSSRYQARQHFRNRTRSCQGTRFRLSQAQPAPATPKRDGGYAHGARLGHGHGRLHVARTGSRRDRGCTQRPVVVRCGPVRNGDGSRPFDGPTSPIIFDALLNKTPQPVRERNPKVPAELERIIGKLLEKDRALRYTSAAELRGDLERLQTGSSPATTSAGASLC